MTNKSTKAYTGGPLVIAKIFRLRMGRALSAEQAALLWQQCEKRLIARGSKRTVIEARESTDGGLDTLPRGDVLDILSLELTGSGWPLNCSSEAESENFVANIRAAMDARGYAVAVKDNTPEAKA